MNHNAPAILSETVALPALDGYPLTATLYHAPEPVAQLLIAGATGSGAWYSVAVSG
jgi:predicted alpha/beta hydrolase